MWLTNFQRWFYQLVLAANLLSDITKIKHHQTCLAADPSHKRQAVTRKNQQSEKITYTPNTPTTTLTITRNSSTKTTADSAGHGAMELNGSATQWQRLAEDALNEALAAAEQTWTPWTLEGDV